MTQLTQEKRINIVRGEWRVSADANVYLSTILGSCVAACIRDPDAKIGGMNHFLLPGGTGRAGGPEMERYGVHLMELLINDLLKSGAQRNRLEAKLFDGAHVVPGLSDIGRQNVDFAEKFLRDEGIRVTGGSVRGPAGRKVEFWPASGRARQMLLTKEQLPSETRMAPAPAPVSSGNVELF